MMFIPSISISGTLLLMIITVTLLIAILLVKTQKERIAKAESSLNKLKTAYEELDEQAKIIVKTDLELNRTQEELDKRMTGLYALHDIGHMISTTLDREEIFRRIKAPSILKLGFSRSLVMLKETKGIACKARTGYKQKDLDEIIPKLEEKKILEKILQQKELLLVNTIEEVKEEEKELADIFDTPSFALVPIISEEKAVGFILGGNDSAYGRITEDDAELLSILANQISQALENARLYEEIWDSHQQLEMRIKQRTRELAKANEELIRYNKMKSDFVSAVSHELRTPLTSIKGYAAILTEGKLGEIPPAVKERLKKINKHSDVLTKMVDDMLDISRIESGKVGMKIEKLEVKDVVDAVIDMITPQIKKKNLKLEIEIPAKLSSISADSTQIERVFINLLSNAMKFTPSQGKISIKAEEEDKFVKIEISDTGTGISEEELPHIFDEFFRCENPINSEVKGTGLGLSLVKRIIAAHEGKIGVTSKTGEGTTFNFTLPKPSSQK